jgi:GNAT superfamily N-acetyltransferase
MKPPRESPEWIEVVTAAERPDLWGRASQEGFLDRVWPEYNHHGNDSPATFRALVPRYGDFQVLFIDQRTDRIIARGRTIPFRWDGTLADLPGGIDALGLRALGEDGAPTALSALAAEVDDDYQGSGLSRLVILTMAALARAHGLRSLVAPVRPNWKDRYPLISIDRYAAWTRPDGLPFDPWMRVHARLGARILRPESQSLHIAAPVEDWQVWVGMAFPEDGQYVFPHGLAPLTVSGGEGDYWEPNVWMSHDAMQPG